MKAIMKNQWISVEKSLPEENGGVMGFSDKVIIFSEAGPLISFYDHWENVWNTSVKNITHWMPLPEPPKE